MKWRSPFAVVVLVVTMPVATLLATPRVVLHVPPPGRYGIEDLWKATVISDTACDAWFEGFVYEETHGQVFHATTKPFRLTLGSKVYGYRSVTIDKTETASGYEMFVTRSGALPDGKYRFRLILVPFGVGDSNGFKVKPMGPPRLILPHNRDTLTDKYPLFVWTPPMPRPSGPLAYDLKLVEVLPGQIPEEAIRSNRPWFEQKGITATQLRYPASARALARPVAIPVGAAPATRGEPVGSEVLGSGDAAVANQSFKLKQRQPTNPAREPGIYGTIDVYVDGIRWKEVPTFLGAGPNEQVYVVSRDDEGESKVTFGDGVHGARLPTGSGNVVVAYRDGAGEANPPAGGITKLAAPVEEIRGVENPAPSAGGADAEAPDSVRDRAPGSLLHRGRAVPLPDTEASTPWRADRRQLVPFLYAWQVSAFVGRTKVGESEVRSFAIGETARMLTREEVIAVILKQVIKPESLDLEVIAFLGREPLGPGDSVSDADDSLRFTGMRGPTWFAWVNDHAMAYFAHPTRYVFVDAYSGKLTVDVREWWPLLNRRPLWVTREEREADRFIFFSNVNRP
jgi:hypothetical protein